MEQAMIRLSSLPYGTSAAQGARRGGGGGGSPQGVNVGVASKIGGVSEGRCQLRLLFGFAGQCKRASLGAEGRHAPASKQGSQCTARQG